MLDDPTHDRVLAQLLLSSGRLQGGQLQAFEGLGSGRPSLARWLVEAGLLRSAEAEELLAGGLAESWSVGGRIGDYRLERRLGAGGMGVVWLARELRTGSPRAIKTLLPHASALSAARFAREVDALTRVDGHPHVVRVHAAGHALGRPYVVLDFAPGGDLAERLERGPLSPDEARRILGELARGLEHVHAHGFLHRDLKPQNVLFAEDGRALLTDFGVARGEHHDALTRSGQVVGTLCYMAPEQAVGEGADVRADVYGLGAILYHMLTGLPPEASVFRGMQSPTDTNPSAPPDLVRVCLRATARDPRRRYPSARAVVQALEHPDADARRWPLVLAGLAALVGVCGVVGALALRGRGEADASPAPPPEVQDPGGTHTAEPAVSPDAAALERFLEGLPEPDPVHRGGELMGMIPGLSGLRSVGDTLRKSDPVQSAAYYLAAIEDGDVDCWARLARQVGDGLVAVEDRPTVYRACLQRGLAEGSPQCALRLAFLRWAGGVEGIAEDYPRAHELYRRALELGERVASFDPQRAEEVQRDVQAALVAFALNRPGAPGAPTAVEALRAAAYHERLNPDPEERRSLRGRIAPLFPLARAELRRELLPARVADPAAEFPADQALPVEVYPEGVRPLRWGLLFKDARRFPEAAASFVEVGDLHGRGWYELYGLLLDVPQELGLEPGDLAGLCVACLWGAAEAERPEPSALNVRARILTRGQPLWPVEPDAPRATALARRGLELATDRDLRADLDLTLAELALVHGGRPGCPTVAEGRAHLEAAAAADRLGFARRVAKLRADYRRVAGE